MTHWKSDFLIVPMKLGNANGGKEKSVSSQNMRTHLLCLDTE